MVNEVDISEELARLWGALEINTYTKLASMREVFPDLRLYRTENGKSIISTTENNPSVDRLDIEVPSDQGAVFVYFFMVMPLDGRLYSEPPGFVLGHVEPSSFGVRVVEDWKEQLESAKIPGKMIEKVSDFLKKNVFVSYQ